MNIYPNGHLDYIMYEDGGAMIGVAKISMNAITQKTTTVSGAGVMGDIEVPLGGMLEPMGLSIEFSSVADAALKLAKMKWHQVEWRVADQYFNSAVRNEDIEQLRYVAMIRPKSINHGDFATASAANVTGEYSMCYYAVYRNGKKIIEIDPLAHICNIDGEDNGAKIRKAIGLM